ncbi:MAG: Mini-ribonuclease 3, partial [Clostridiales bacterium]|nr:Mini-ribonuclease 3 [Clostridiales bacterium]
VFRRGKNSNPTSSARNASPSDYKYATGMEAVIGYLFLTDHQERLDELITHIFELSEEEEP